MPTRRNLMTTAGAVSLMASAGVAPADATSVGTTPPVSPKGPRGMPRGLRLLTIRQADGAETLGVKTSSGILDVAAASKMLGMEAPVTLEQMLADASAPALDALVKAAATRPEVNAKALHPEASVTFGRLFVNPGKIVCVGLNYRQHAHEIGAPVPTEPVLFNKYNNTLAAHNCTIKVPPQDVTAKLDYETELLIVMGRQARNVSEADALDYVAGYAVGHDFSARDLQLEKGGQWMVGKTLDGFAPIGPYFVSADLVDPNKLRLQTRVNGETRQDSSTADFIFSPQQVIAYSSKLFALEPGDIIFTGTPQGVIVGKPKDKQIWLKAGDKIESEIEGLGVLRFDLA